MNVGIKDFQTVAEKAKAEGIKLEVQCLRCSECVFWCGRCLKGKKNRVASSPACEESTPR